MRTHLSKLLTVISLAVLLTASFSVAAARPAEAKSKPWSFITTLKPGVWYGYYLGPASSGAAYLVDITPLHKSIDGAYVKSVIQVEYDGETWNDVLRVQLPPEFPKLKVEITIYRPTGLETIYDGTAAFLPGDWNGFPVAKVDQYQGGYLVRAIPLSNDAPAADLNQYIIQPEFDGKNWNDVLRIEMRNTDWGQLDYNFKIYACDKKSCP